jgi:hypothetical protein
MAAHFITEQKFVYPQPVRVQPECLQLAYIYGSDFSNTDPPLILVFTLNTLLMSFQERDSMYLELSPPLLPFSRPWPISVRRRLGRLDLFLRFYSVSTDPDLQ